MLKTGLLRLSPKLVSLTVFSFIFSEAQTKISSLLYLFFFFSFTLTSHLSANTVGSAKIFPESSQFFLPPLLPPISHLKSWSLFRSLISPHSLLKTDTRGILSKSKSSVSWLSTEFPFLSKSWSPYKALQGALWLASLPWPLWFHHLFTSY